MMNKKINVLDRLKKESFKKKEEVQKIETKEFQITVVEKENFNPKDTLFNYDLIQDLEMKNDLINFEKRLIVTKNNYHTSIGEILFEANKKYANNKNGVFGLWLNHMQINKKNAERLINRFSFIKENLSSKEEISYFETLPLSLTYEISSPSAPKELVDAVLNKQIKTRKEYIQLKELPKKETMNSYTENDINTLLFNLNSNLNNLIKSNNFNIDNKKADSVCKKINSLNDEILKLLKNL